MLCFRKEGCVIITLPASCCVQQQFKIPLQLLHGTRKFPFTGLCSFVEESSCLIPQQRGNLVSFTVIMTQMFKIHKLIHLHNGEVSWNWSCSEGALLQAACWVVCAGMHLDYRGGLQCKAIISTGLTTMHCSRHCSAKKRLVLLYSVAMWHFGYSHLCLCVDVFSFSTWMAWHSPCLLVSGE